MKFIFIFTNEVSTPKYQLDLNLIISNNIWINYLNEIMIWINQTALIMAIEKENTEIIKLLLSDDRVDVNAIDILMLMIL